MKSPLACIAWLSVVAWSSPGCTVISQYNDVQSTQQRVNEKQTELANEEMLHAQLTGQMQQLSADLTNRKMSSDELDRRLVALQKQSDQLAATNAQEKQKTAQTRAQITQYRAELEAIKRDKTLSDAQANEQITALKEEIRKRLAILAAAE
jgi:site-specific recombinase